MEADKLLLTLLENEEVIRRKWCVAFHAKGKFWEFPPSIMHLPFYPREYIQQMILARLRKNTTKTPPVNSLQRFIEDKTGHSYYNDLFSSFILKKTCMSGDKIHRDWFWRTDRDIENRKEIPKKAIRLKSWYSQSKGLKQYRKNYGKNIVLWVGRQSVTVALYLFRKNKIISKT